MRMTLSTVLLFFLVISSAYSATERRTALVIGNSNYNTGSLRNPVNDADDMASTLKRLGFAVILKKNATQQEMELLEKQSALEEEREKLGERQELL
jgi:hypothetical protein